MAKYSVNGTEIIDDSGLIDWNKIKNKPLTSAISSFAVTVTSNCGTGGNVSASVTNSSPTSVKLLNVTMSGGGADFNCLCQCDCDCACMGS